MAVRPILTILVAAAVLTGGLALAPPASAETVVVDDGADAAPSLTDIRKVRLRHGGKNVVVRTTFPNLKKSSDASMTVFLDTKRSRRGPEFGIGLPLFSGGDFVLVRMKRWKYVGGPVNCSYGAEFAWKSDYLKLRFDRDCFDNRNRVRVGMKMRDDHDASHPIVDWLNGWRGWTAWASAG
jgi:hypothetical protein